MHGTFSIIVRKTLLIAVPLALASSVVLPAPASAVSPNCQQRKSCVLVFTTQPADAEAGAHITDTAFTPSGAGVNDVKVQLQVANADGSPSGTAVTGLADTISLELVAAATNTATSVTLTYGPATLDATTGTLTFSTLNVDTHGNYRLKASDASNSRGVLPGVSTSSADPPAAPYFTIWDDVQPCSGSCVSNLSPTSHETVVVTSASTTGQLASSLGADNKDAFLRLGASSDCGAPKSLKAQFGPNVTGVGGTSLDTTGTKTVTLTYDQAYVNAQANNGASFYQICYESTESFQDINNQPAQQLPSGDYYGLLPYPCGSTSKPFSKATPVTAPCIEAKTKNTGSGTVTIVLLLPSADPHII
ncbi:MAG: hypothetical protein ACXVQ6_10805 [Actinomycetota bacterium]